MSLMQRILGKYPKEIKELNEGKYQENKIMTKIIAHIMKILHKQNPHINRSALYFYQKN